MRPRGTVQRPRCQPGTDVTHCRPHTPHLPRHTLRRPARTHAVADDGSSSTVEASQATRPDLYRVPNSLTRDDADAVQSIAAQARAELSLLLDLLPANARKALQHTLAADEEAQLLEVVLDLGRPPLARFPSGDMLLDEAPVTRKDLLSVTSQVGVFGGDNRAGIDRTLHRISCIRNRDGAIVGLTCRVGRAVPGAAVMVADLVEQGRSILLLGRPGAGKTTAIRDISRMQADAGRKRVVIVDTSNEIGGDGDVPHPAIGGARRMQVPDPSLQHRVMIEAVENHMPEVVVIDEIGTEAEAAAAQTISQRGVQLVGTAHGNELGNVLKNPALSSLLGGITSVTLGDEVARRRGGAKSVLEREGPPSFDVVVQIIDRSHWEVHDDVVTAVDSLLRGSPTAPQLRVRDPRGGVAVLLGADADAVRTRLHADHGLEAGEAPASLSALVGQAGRPRRGGDDEGLSPTWGPASPWSDSPPPAATPPSPTSQLRVYLFGIEAGAVQAATWKLGLPEGAVVCTDRLPMAHAVLAIRSKVKQGGWIKNAARAQGVVIYTVKSDAETHLTKALRTLLGLDPSAGSMFDRSVDRSVDRLSMDSSDDEDVVGGDPVQDDAAGNALSTAAATATRDSDTPALDRASGVFDEALHEARTAIEQFVLTQQHPVELLPRKLAVLEHTTLQSSQAQVALLQGYEGLQYELVGDAAANTQRLRVLPAGFVRDRGALKRTAARVEFW